MFTLYTCLHDGTGIALIKRARMSIGDALLSLLVFLGVVVIVEKLAM